jgi:hypothetical protein
VVVIDKFIVHFKTKIVFSIQLVMFGIKDNTITTHTQLDNKSIIDEVIESKIKECQRENGRLMTRTSQRLREQYGFEMVDRVVNRLSRRRQRKNQNFKKNSELINLISDLAKRSNGFTTDSRFEF